MKVCFIINPIAGVKIRKLTENLIRQSFSATEDEIEIHYSKYAGHCKELASKAVEKGFQTIAVAGGDGTVNEVGSALINTGVNMAIIPIGSGNGLAHHLKLPFKVQKAVKLIHSGKVLTIDAGKIDSSEIGTQYFFSNSGVGYDAEVIHAYSNVKARGFATYIFFMFKSIFTLKAPRLNLKFNQEEMELEPFVFTVANSSQYGYKIKVAPEAGISDGVLDALLVKDASFLRVLKFAITSSLNMTDSIKDAADYYRVKHVLIDFKQRTKLQIDGEPFFVEKPLEVNILPAALNILVPDKTIRKEDRR